MPVWALLGLWLCAMALALIHFRGAFAPEKTLAEIPALWLAGGGVAAGLSSLLLVPMVRRTERADPATVRLILGFVLLVGLALRAMMLLSAPALEVDYRRYLWDGAMVANGFSPYALAPAEIADLLISDPRSRLAAGAGAVFEGISYPHVRTVYPPVAQAAFAISHLMAPFSLTAWRLVCIGGELATAAILLNLLAEARRSPLWVALYWWSPLAIKELVNSAHMEAVLIPLVLGALLLSVRGRHLSATAALGLAAGVKLWPVLLAPLLLRPLVGDRRRLALASLLLVGLLALVALPILAAGLDRASGFVAYATHWKTNSALFPWLERAVRGGLAPLGIGAETAGLALRAGLAATLVAGAVALSRAPLMGARDIAARALLIISGLTLLSPAQFPWYILWPLPLAAIWPSFGWLFASAIAPVYYSAFHFHAAGTYAIYRDIIVWAIWVPVWLLLWRDLRRYRRASGA